MADAWFVGRGSTECTERAEGLETAHPSVNGLISARQALAEA
jgi:hypothetical protein